MTQTAGNLRDLHGIRLADRPLIVCDVDDVVLDFVTPFIAFLKKREHELRPVSFRLTGNVYSLKDGLPADRDAVKAFTDAFFAEQDLWQNAAEAAVETLDDLAREADIVFLTAMPPRHRDLRRRVLKGLGLTHPIIATEEPKGPTVHALHGGRDLPLAFVDDLYVNLHSVRDHAPAALLVNLSSRHVLAPFAPHPGDGVTIAADWHEAARHIRAHFSGGRGDA
jgi:hypothetical protein